MALLKIAFSLGAFLYFSKKKKTKNIRLIFKYKKTSHKLFVTLDIKIYGTDPT
jgi:hypothetical protein